MRDLLKAIILFIILIAGMACALFGCTVTPAPTVASPLTGQSIARAQVLVERSKLTLTGLMPQMPIPIVPIVAGVTQDLGTVTGDLIKAATGNQQMVDQNAAQAKVIIEQDVKLKELDDDFFSPMQKRWTLYIALAWAGLGLTGMLLGAFGGTTAVGIGSFILRALPGANPFSFVRDKIKPPAMAPTGAA